VPGGEEDELFACAAPTAKRLKARAVLVEPHLGHSIFSSPLIVRTSFSNFDSQLLQVYS
jgi:hypothetical protein